MYKCTGGKSPAPSTTTAPCVDEDDVAPGPSTQGLQSVVEAIKAKGSSQLGFGFSAGGLLCAYCTVLLPVSSYAIAVPVYDIQ